MAFLKTVVSSLGSSSDFFALFGVLTASAIAFKSALGVFRFISTYIFAGLLGLSADLKKAGSWAVITGCTDGIGKAYAEQIAKKGINVVLISRTQSKLNDLAKEIEERYKVETRTIAVDFGHDSQSDIYTKIRLGIASLDVGTLVNNVGRSYDHPEYFADLENRDKLVMDMINVNITSCSMMTSLVLPTMVEKRKGIIINIASTAAVSPLPLLAVYSATKVYMDYFSRALQYETANKGIICQVVLPGFVATKLSKIRATNFMVPSPTTYVRSALATVGIESRTFGFWSHAIQGFLSEHVIPTKLAVNVLSNARSGALRKKSKQKDS